MADGEPQGATGRPCPACGVNVAAGYPRCPKCHTAMPGASAAGAAPPAHQMVAGGTSAAASGPGLVPWLAGGVGVGVLAIVLVMTLGGGGDDGGDATEEATAPSVEAGDDVALSEEPGGGGVGADRIDLADALPDEEPGSVEAIRDLDAALRGRNLWSQVRDDGGGVVIVQSSLCEDAGMNEVLGEESASLVEAGFTIVRCVAPHGGTIFERDL